MDLAQLKRAMMQNSQATSQLTGLDEKFSRAAALRDAPATQMDQYGQVSPLAILGDIIGKSRGRRDMRQLGAERDKVRATISDTDSMINTNKLERTLAEEKRKEESHEDTLKTSADSLLTSAVNREKTEKEMREVGDVERWANKNDPKDVIAVQPDSNGNPMVQNQETGLWDIPVDSSQYVQENKYAGRGKYGRGYTGVPMNTKAQDTLSDRFHTATVVGELADRWDDSFTQLTGLPTGFADKVVTGLQNQGILDYLGNPDISEKARNSVQWWADWRMNYTGPARHKFFGATLTPNELAAWREAEAINPGMPAAQIKRRLDRIHELSKISIVRRANVGLRGRPADREIYLYLGKQYGMDYNEETNTLSMKGVFDTEMAEPPTGISDWDDWSDEEKNLYLSDQESLEEG